MRAHWFLFLSFLCLASCQHQQQEKLLFTQDYEQSFGWNDVPVEQGQAHTGNWAERMMPDRAYSFTFSTKLAELPLEKISSIKAGVWALSAEMNEAVYLVTALTNEKGEQLEYATVNMQEAFRRKQEWTFFQLNIKPRQLYAGSTQLKVYVWNAGKQRLLLDDFIIVFEK